MRLLTFGRANLGWLTFLPICLIVLSGCNANNGANLTPTGHPQISASPEHVALAIMGGRPDPKVEGSGALVQRWETPPCIVFKNGSDVEISTFNRAIDRLVEQAGLPSPTQSCEGPEVHAVFTHNMLASLEENKDLITKYGNYEDMKKEYITTNPGYFFFRFYKNSGGLLGALVTIDSNFIGKPDFDRALLCVAAYISGYKLYGSAPTVCRTGSPAELTVWDKYVLNQLYGPNVVSGQTFEELEESLRTNKLVAPNAWVEPVKKPKSDEAI